VLDLYAGQGRFGIAALEEGASEVVFVEKNGRSAQAIAKVLERQRDRVKVITADVFAYFAREPEKFSLVFADPPFPDWDEKGFAEKLFGGASTRLEPEGIFLVKCPSRMVLSPPPQALNHWKSVAFGESTLAYFTYGGEQT
jgi:16S rRNA G966 N2-methylase RsmD